MELPLSVFEKHGAFYLVRRGKWIRLTSIREDVWREYETLQGRDFKSQAEHQAIANYLLRTLARSRGNALGRRQLDHDLSKAEVMELMDEAGWRCAVTGTPFSLETVGPRKQRPYAPSIDRIDNSRGYSRSNCRIVCAAANIAMNTWGEEVLLRIARFAHEKLSGSFRHRKTIGQNR